MAPTHRCVCMPAPESGDSLCATCGGLSRTFRLRRAICQICGRRGTTGATMLAFAGPFSTYWSATSTTPLATYPSGIVCAQHLPRAAA